MLVRDALRQPEAQACSRFLVCCEEQFEDSFAVRKEPPTWVVFFWNRQGFRAGAWSMTIFCTCSGEAPRTTSTDQSGPIELIAGLQTYSRYFLAGRASLDQEGYCR